VSLEDTSKKMVVSAGFGLQICSTIKIEKANLKVNLSPFTTYLRASSLCGEGNPVTHPIFFIGF
jgi:hypothetical protein